MIDVPGATLYYETHGSGPVLLLIPGGAGDAGMYAGMIAQLADQYTVVSYDPRGLSRSKLSGPVTDQVVAEWSSDARCLLDVVTPDEPAFVMGCSSGAIVALDLLARHPERVRGVIAHEPPSLNLLPDPVPWRELFAEVREISLTDGVGPAMAVFNKVLDEPEFELPPEIQEMLPRMVANMPFSSRACWFHSPRRCRT
ncbi:alpha/beta hydrolase [Kibdelosporangium philippinense]|uniref:Alpha/beta hydrolase n=1 Tax=Kibdelosporangium philippinense TaxID=211113 RepID=A0ABS8ZTK0_9PSEU|nr:alpha/beta hydrolase [Kibdelosporangium philippinense]MCE7011055.1 alpha/beta hydrolase [Kibdelosporangium philippinense]